MRDSRAHTLPPARFLEPREPQRQGSGSVLGEVPGGGGESGCAPRTHPPLNRQQVPTCSERRKGTCQRLSQGWVRVKGLPGGWWVGARLSPRPSLRAAKETRSRESSRGPASVSFGGRGWRARAILVPHPRPRQLPGVDPSSTFRSLINLSWKARRG